MKNPNEFWDTAHAKQNGYWLTGSELAFLCELHEIDPPKNKVVLEVGVGLGCATRELARDNRVIAVDISQAALDNLRDSRVVSRFLTENMGRIPDNTVDFALCHLVFQHCEDDAVKFILEETIRTLRPDGLFILQSGDSQSPKGQNIGRTQRRELIWRHPDRVRQLITEAGGRVVSERISQRKAKDIIWQLLKIAKNI